jgi:hypothetical protein
MIRLAIVDHEGKTVALKDIATADDLLQIVEQARNLIRDCDQLMRQHAPQNLSAGSGKTPYLS